MLNFDDIYKAFVQSITVQNKNVHKKMHQN